jgi:hypothetical protein
MLQFKAEGSHQRNVVSLRVDDDGEDPVSPGGRDPVYEACANAAASTRCDIDNSIRRLYFSDESMEGTGSFGSAIDQRRDRRVFRSYIGERSCRRPAVCQQQNEGRQPRVSAGHLASCAR